MFRTLARNADNVLSAAFAMFAMLFIVGILLRLTVKYAPENLGHYVETVADIAGYDELS